MIPLLVALLFAPQAPANDWALVPGVRVGPITAVTVRADLDRFFPKGSVEDDEIELDEGILQPATFVFRKDPSQTLAISWNGTHPKQVFICHGLRRGTCRWQAPNGIHFGTRLNEIESLNGGPFTVSGFSFYYGGNVLSWDGGKLAKLDCNGRLVLTLDGERAGKVQAIRGDRPIPSSTPEMRKLNPSVVGMLFQFAGPDSKRCE